MDDPGRQHRPGTALSPPVRASLAVLALAASSTASAADLRTRAPSVRSEEHALGVERFDAVAFDPQPDPRKPRDLRLFLSPHSPIEFVITNPPDPVRPVLRMVLAGADAADRSCRSGSPQGDPAVGGPRLEERIVEADLSGLRSAEPVR
jgi:hypothetical protein